MSDDADAPAQMYLTVLLPHEILIERQRISRIVVETRSGSFGLLPRRLDCVCALTTGIVVYDIADTVDGGAADNNSNNNDNDNDNERYVAVDEGVMTKAGAEVRIAVRRAITGTNLTHLKDAVAASFLAEDDMARSVRDVMNRLEGSFIRRLVTLHHG